MGFEKYIDKPIQLLVGVLLVSALAVNTIPSIQTSLGNISTIANNPFSGLFASNGVINTLIFVSLLLLVIGLVFSKSKNNK